MLSHTTDMLPILTTCLQVDFYQINKWLYETGRSIDDIYAIKTNNFDSDIPRVHEMSFLKKIGHGLVIVSKTQIKFAWFFKLYILIP